LVLEVQVAVPAELQEVIPDMETLLLAVAVMVDKALTEPLVF